jgi:hypothetical protein
MIALLENLRSMEPPRNRQAGRRRRIAPHTLTFDTRLAQDAAYEESHSPWIPMSFTTLAISREPSRHEASSSKERLRSILS